VSTSSFDQQGRFILSGFTTARPFASFLPGIAGPLGIPLWVFYVNRGQAIASFGMQSKDTPILEFQPANKAYQQTPYLGFRTFLKLKPDSLYEPFVPSSTLIDRQMAIGMNELEIQEINLALGLQTNVVYFTVPNEDYAGLVRQATVKNIASRPIDLEILDGLPAISPYGVNNTVLKEIGRTVEAWMEVFNHASGVPFYRLRASVADSAEVETIEAGHFALAFSDTQQLPALIDPNVVFGQNTSLSTPDRFNAASLAELLAERQITTGKTPCAFFSATASLAPHQAITLYGVYGHVSHVDKLAAIRSRLKNVACFAAMRVQANALTLQLTDVIDTQTSEPLFDAYCRQTFLDNVIRGGWPITWEPATDLHATTCVAPLSAGTRRERNEVESKHARAKVYHLYSRKHGDLERDYNAFTLAAEYYSQGNGSYRDVNQNRRNDVFFNPSIGDFNLRMFMSLVQADGYNPLVTQGSTFTLPPDQQAAVLEFAEHPEALQAVIARPFTPGQLLKHIVAANLPLRVTPEEFLTEVMGRAEQHIEATFGEGYWIDHWTYNLDLIDTYLAVYPDRKNALLFEDATLPFFDSPAFVQPRSKKYVLAHGQPRQFGAVWDDHEKAALIASRTDQPNWLRIDHGRGAIYRTTLFAKLVSLAVIKFATLDPGGMGIEMEAGRPGWFDALNGLPGLFGSSLAETFELQRLIEFLLAALHENPSGSLELPIELSMLLGEVVNQLQAYHAASDPRRDFVYWDQVAAARETYRASIRLGLSGEVQSIEWPVLAHQLTLFASKVAAGIERAVELNNGLPPTYFTYEVTAYDLIGAASGTPQADAQGRSFICARAFKANVLPLFLEGPVHALKVRSRTEAARLYRQIKASPLFDRALKMYKVNASLADQPPDIGRVRVFTPGWLENESIWLHMEYKYLLEVLRAGLYTEFFEDFKATLVPFLDPQTYGRSLLENSSFLVSSAHPDPSLHGAGFVARLTGSSAEFLSIWQIMLMGQHPFVMHDGQLCLTFNPILPGWLFTNEGDITFRFLDRCTVTYHNPSRRDTFDREVQIRQIRLQTETGEQVELASEIIGPDYAQLARDGQITHIDVYWQENGS
jgi:hypothetical protein